MPLEGAVADPHEMAGFKTILCSLKFSRPREKMHFLLKDLNLFTIITDINYASC